MASTNRLTSALASLFPAHLSTLPQPQQLTAPEVPRKGVVVFSITMIDRYLLWLYMRVLLLSFTSLAGLLVIINLFSNLDDFIEYGKREGECAFALRTHFVEDAVRKMPGE